MKVKQRILRLERRLNVYRKDAREDSCAVFWSLRVLIGITLVIAILFGGIASGAEIDPWELQQNTVVLTDGSGHGSGVLWTREDDGKRTTFIWTAAHVADMWMRPDGSFREVDVLQGGKHARARVLRCGDYEVDTDCAVLEIIAGNMEGTAHFYRAFKHVKPGQRIVHCGTPLNIGWNERLVSYGRFSYIDRLCEGRPLTKPRKLDQVDLTAYPGCSGGPVVDLEDGGIVGLVILGSRPGIHCIEPTRYIYEWCKTHDCLWAFDPEVSIPRDRFAWPGDVMRRPDAWQYRDADQRWGDPAPEPEPEPAPEPKPRLVPPTDAATEPELPCVVRGQAA